MLNLVEPRAKRTLFDEIFRVLQKGGRAVLRRRQRRLRLMRTFFPRAMLAVTFALVVPAAMHGAEPGRVFQSGSTRTALVELYTSEGCSSCPPAEAWLNRLGTLPGLWTEFVPVALHVNYWDHLGWRDPWASRQFTDRQRASARGWNSDTVYTPGVVLNGQEWRAWSGRNGVPRSSESVGVLTARSTDGVRWRIEFAPTGPHGQFEAWVALLSRGLESNVRAGENRGRRLHHDFVAVALVSAPMRKNGDTFRAETAIPANRSPGESLRALAVWVTSAGQLAPLQAIGGDLPRAPR